MKSQRPFTWLLLASLLVIGSTACILTDLAQPGGSTSKDLESTQIAMAVTQVALDAQAAALQQTVEAIQSAETEQHAAPDESSMQPTVQFEGISFSVDPLLSADIRPQIVPEQPDELTGSTLPQHISFTFADYYLADTFHDPVIRIYPLGTIDVENEDIAYIVDRLQTVLNERPAARPNEGLPFLPIFHAAQIFASNIDYIDFENGSGVRYLTQYAQALVPINNQELFYTYQGITADGAYYVSVLFPIQHPALQADGMEVPSGDWETFAENYEPYLNDIITTLEAQPNAAFMPNMTLMDDVVRSLHVE